MTRPIGQTQVDDAQGIITDFYDHPQKSGFDASSHSIDVVSLRREEVELVATLIREYKPAKTIEVGLALAASAIAIMANKKQYDNINAHIALDPFQESDAKNAGLIEVKRLGLSAHLNFVPRFSEDYLNECYQKGLKFDFILIDGAHTIGQAVTDVFLSDKILEKNGIIVTHDSLLYATAASIKYLITQRGYKIVSEKNYSFKTLLRMAWYAPLHGWSFVMNVIPRIKTSVVVLQKCD